MSKKAWIIFVIAVIGLLVALVMSSRSSAPQINVSTIDASSIQPPSEANGNIGDHTFGNLDSEIVLVEYSDFQCPACANAQPTAEALRDKYSDRVLFIFRNYPIPSLHPNARAAAAAAEAAGLQDKYWEMHDELFARQSEWGSADATKRNEIFARYASELSLDMDKFNSDLSSSAISQKINIDISIGKENGVNATPTFVLNGETLNVNELETAIEAKLAG